MAERNPARAPPNAPADEHLMNELAGLVADGCELGLAARRLGVPASRARDLWAQIVDRLGRQALD